VIFRRYKWSFKSQLHDLHNYNTRRASNTQIVYSRTPFYRNSFLPLAVCEWNNLPIEVGRNSSKYTLKRFLNRNAVKIPSYFNTGSNFYRTKSLNRQSGCCWLFLCYCYVNRGVVVGLDCINILVRNHGTIHEI
jgi:hypothetical protein